MEDTVPGPEVMLASPAGAPPADAIADLTRRGFLFDIKWDGIRAVVTRTDDGTIRITNRRQADITARYPDIVATFQEAGERGFVGVVDGEIVVVQDGRVSFAAAHRRDAQSSTARIRSMAATVPAVFIGFDILEADGVDVRSEPFRRRRNLLVETGLRTGVTVSSVNADGAAMWEYVTSHGTEGLVAKNPEAAYRAGRSKSWVKVKSTRRVSALVGGIVPGKGSRGAIGALDLYLWDPDADQLVAIGQVGSGLADRDLRRIKDMATGNAPIVVEVEYLEVSPNGKLRFPVFKGFRTDIDIADCVVTGLQR